MLPVNETEKNICHFKVGKYLTVKSLTSDSDMGTDLVPLRRSKEWVCT